MRGKQDALANLAAFSDSVQHPSTCFAALWHGQHGCCERHDDRKLPPFRQHHHRPVRPSPEQRRPQHLPMRPCTSCSTHQPQPTPPHQLHDHQRVCSISRRSAMRPIFPISLAERPCARRCSSTGSVHLRQHLRTLRKPNHSSWPWSRTSTG